MTQTGEADGVQAKTCTKTIISNSINREHRSLSDSVAEHSQSYRILYLGD